MRDFFGSLGPAFHFIFCFTLLRKRMPFQSGLGTVLIIVIPIKNIAPDPNRNPIGRFLEILERILQRIEIAVNITRKQL